MHGPTRPRLASLVLPLILLLPWGYPQNLERILPILHASAPEPLQYHLPLQGWSQPPLTVLGVVELVLELAQGVEQREELFGFGDLVPVGGLGIEVAREECRGDLVEEECGNILPLLGDSEEVAQKLVVFGSPE